jgi:FHS family glucose/mannose:H+ symporter-like MFS transporter
LGFAAAPTWPVALAAAAIIGVGFGALVVGLNRIFATGFGARSAALLNILGASFGFGAIVGPLSLPISDGRFALPFMGCASMAAVGLPLVLRTPQIPPSANHTAAIRRHVPGRLWGFTAFYVLYVGVESGIGGWEATHLLSQDASEASAANWTAAYWGAITLGRVLAAPIALRVAPSRLVVAALVLTAAALALAHVALLTPIAYVAAGLVLAPVFPTGLAWVTSSLPSIRGATAAVIACAQLGGVIIPPVIGRLVAMASPAIIPTSVLAVAATCLTTAQLLNQRHPVARTDV